jgi:glycosyltransferase involved in cell wall biosynthesis
MNILLVTDTYPPLRTSGAVMMQDLAMALIKQGHIISVVVPRANQSNSVNLVKRNGCSIFSVRTFPTKDVNYLFRLFAEWINPFLIWFRLSRYDLFTNQKFDGLAWYAPSIFWGPFIERFKAKFGCKAYLILRDIFPDWALDLGLIKPGLLYWILKRVEHNQYAQACKIGVQSPNNLTYLINNNPGLQGKAEVLWNWVGESLVNPCSININQTSLKGRFIFVYAGNLGVAQGIDTLFDLAAILKEDKSIGFIFVGRGSEVGALKAKIQNGTLPNTLFFDEIDPFEMPGLYSQCNMGLLSLDLRHTTHNIPGKFLSYMRAGLPVFANVNPGNDLVYLATNYKIGMVCNILDEQSLEKVANLLRDKVNAMKSEYYRNEISSGCRKITEELFDPNIAVEQIVKIFESAKFR